jgi:osmotically inducible protein OsmC
MAVRTANAVWEGTLNEGKGTVSLGSGAFEGQYSFSSRFEEGTGTNPEELIGAAHAGCYAMALNAGLGRAGFPATRVSTAARVHITKQEAGMRISKIELDVEAVVPGIEDAQFQELAESTKSNCIVSVALAAVPEITVNAKLVQ